MILISFVFCLPFQKCQVFEAGRRVESEGCQVQMHFLMLHIVILIIRSLFVTNIYIAPLLSLWLQ